MTGRIFILLSLLSFFLPGISITAMTEKRSDTAVMEFLGREYNVKFTDNNRIVLLKSGTEKFDDMLEVMAAAKKSIHLEYFNFRNDSISEELFTLLAKKAAEGVKVRALFDGFGNSSNNKPLRKRHLERLREEGVEIYEFDPLRFPWINHAFHRDHRKIVIIDGMVGYTGGMNVADYYIHGKPEFGDWRDLHMRVEGDAVAWLQGVFISFWNKVTGQEVEGPEYYPGEKDARNFFPELKPDTNRTAGQKTVGVVNRDPDRTSKIILDTFVKSLDNAKTQVQIINPYFTLNRKLKRAFKRAIKRGVDVQIMVSAKSDIPVTPRIVEYNVNKLMKQGASIYVYEGGFHHTKIMMVDSLFSFVGSANMNSRSLGFDYECNLLIADKATTLELQKMFEEDKCSSCFKLTPETRKKMPCWQRFKGWLFHFLSPFVDNGRKENLRQQELVLDTKCLSDYA